MEIPSPSSAADKPTSIAEITFVSERTWETLARQYALPEIVQSDLRYQARHRNVGGAYTSRKGPRAVERADQPAVIGFQRLETVGDAVLANFLVLYLHRNTGPTVSSQYFNVGSYSFTACIDRVSVQLAKGYLLNNNTLAQMAISYRLYETAIPVFEDVPASSKNCSKIVRKNLADMVEAYVGALRVGGQTDELYDWMESVFPMLLDEARPLIERQLSDGRAKLSEFGHVGLCVFLDASYLAERLLNSTGRAVNSCVPTIKKRKLE